MNPKLLLLGYSGKRNFGDDLLLKQAYDAFGEIAEIHIHTNTLDQNSDYLHSWFPNAIIFKSLKLDYHYLKKFTHVLSFGGGVLFNYNKVSLKNYWRKRLSILKNFNWIKSKGTHFAGIGIGLGPFIDDRSEDLCFRQLKNFDYLNVRDSISLELCRGHKLKNLSLCEDLSITNYRYYHSLKIQIQKRKKRIIICPRKYPHGKNKDQYLKNLISASDKLKLRGEEIFVYGFQSGHDECVIEEFSKRGFETGIWNPAIMKIEDLIREFADCKLIISARMHGVYIAGILDVPVIGIGVHQKLKMASELFSNSLSVPDTFETEEMYKCIQHLSELPDNNFELLCEKEKQCKHEYELIKKWLESDLI